MKINEKLADFFKAAIISISITFIMAIGFHFVSEGILRRFFILFGGDFLGGGYIQCLTFTAFFWAFFEIKHQLKIILGENKAFKSKILPTEEKHLIIPSEISELHLKVSSLNKKKNSLLYKMIIKACLKFRATKSIPEMIEIISIQTDINKELSESDQSNIRYLTWVIPSIGFVGTVLGISQALMIANSGDMEVITATLGVAFDTTLVSLLLSIIIMWYYHALLRENDLLHAKIKDYVIENLINRIEIE
ncbi:hypothetical protein BIY24_06415 [Halobacteriovorax marinus]|uniref:Membrane protein n=1 Tax=Halobacteriovorax marinus (strain ATCC BAA-682 / DSM 15412 / SJ) TaxID=862908 RepID=E1WZN6_HALMS|nr:MotA/TolQ/ExbB proton channel family protein [Halobacteriovorax marinus]ATH07591.1 hypothetical protein BIY24_06415 [Halobacteriovorax marinus]CBW26222.1 putative membrane protein [Halobacteriovorax marinus SJ]